MLQSGNVQIRDFRVYVIENVEAFSCVVNYFFQLVYLFIVRTSVRFEMFDVFLVDIQVFLEGLNELEHQHPDLGLKIEPEHVEAAEVLVDVQDVVYRISLYIFEHEFLYNKILLR